MARYHIVTNRWSKPAYKLLDEAGVDLSEALDRIADFALRSKTGPKVFSIKGKRGTVTISSRRR